MQKMFARITAGDYIPLPEARAAARLLTSFTSSTTGMQEAKTYSKKHRWHQTTQRWHRPPHLSGWRSSQQSGSLWGCTDVVNIYVGSFQVSNDQVPTSWVAFQAGVMGVSGPDSPHAAAATGPARDHHGGHAAPLVQLRAAGEPLQSPPVAHLLVSLMSREGLLPTSSSHRNVLQGASQTPAEKEADRHGLQPQQRPLATINARLLSRSPAIMAAGQPCRQSAPELAALVAGCKIARKAEAKPQRFRVASAGSS